MGENLKEAGNHEAERMNTRWRGEIDEVSGEWWGMAAALAVSLGLAAVDLYETRKIIRSEARVSTE